MSWQRHTCALEAALIVGSLVLMTLLRLCGGGRWLVEHRPDIGAGAAVSLAVAAGVATGHVPETFAPLAAGGLFLVPWMGSMALYFCSLILRKDHPPRHWYRFAALLVLWASALRILRQARPPVSEADLRELCVEWVTLEVFALWVVKLRLNPPPLPVPKGYKRPFRWFDVPPPEHTE